MWIVFSNIVLMKSERVIKFNDIHMFVEANKSETFLARSGHSRKTRTRSVRRERTPTATSRWFLQFLEKVILMWYQQDANSSCCHNGESEQTTLARAAIVCRCRFNQARCIYYMFSHAFRSASVCIDVPHSSNPVSIEHLSHTLGLHFDKKGFWEPHQRHPITTKINPQQSFCTDRSESDWRKCCD